MNAPGADTRCPHTDAVLAHLLDGDLGTAPYHDTDGGTAADRGAGEPAALPEHLRGCPTCQTALRRARRLDAALAQAAGQAVATHGHRHGSDLTHLAQRWFAVAVAAGSRADASPAGLSASRARTTHRVAPVGRTAPGRMPPLAMRSDSPTRSERVARNLTAPRTMRWLAAAVALLLGLLWTFPRAADGATGTIEATGATVTAATATAIELPAEALRRWRNQPGTTSAEQRATPPLAELQRRLADEQLDARERLGSARQLLAAAAPLGGHHRDALSGLVVAMAGQGDRTPAAQVLHGELLDLLRGNQHALGLLQARLHALAAPGQQLLRTELAFVVVGARLGTPLLDAALRRVVRRHPTAAPCIAAALRAGQRTRPAGLLLDLWHDLDAVGAVPDDEHTAAAWFTDQSTATFDDLAVELRSSRDGPRRRRCLLALGCAADASTLPTLLPHLDSPHLEEAITAAFAIGCLPRPVLAPLLAAAAAPEAQLLRAALVRADLPGSRRWSASVRGLAGVDLAAFTATAASLRDLAHCTD